MKRILLIEDEADLRELMSLHLKRDGYEVEVAEDGARGLEKARSGAFDLLVVDWMLPELSGLELCQKLRQDPTFRLLPILMVTARVEASDVIRGLDAGADDYVTKPFEIPVFLARARALLRRAESHRDAPQDETARRKITIEHLVVDLDAVTVRCGTQDISLTPSEFKLLSALVENRGRALSREKLIALVQGEGVTVVDRAVDTHVFGLRKKLGDCGALIETIRGIGYRVGV